MEREREREREELGRGRGGGCCVLFGWLVLVFCVFLNQKGVLSEKKYADSSFKGERQRDRQTQTD